MMEKPILSQHEEGVELMQQLPDNSIFDGEGKRKGKLGSMHGKTAKFEQLEF